MDLLTEFKVTAAADYVKQHLPVGIEKPLVAIIAGTGLSRLSKGLSANSLLGKLSYEDIPEFPVPTAKGHPGELVFLNMEDVPVMVLNGRVHLYEGRTNEEVVMGVRLAHAMGARLLIVTNAAGNLNPAWRAPAIMTVTDHFNFQFTNALVATEEDPEVHIVDMSEPYAGRWIRWLAFQNIEHLVFGRYVATLGPSLSTRMEYEFFRNCIQADAIGMSSVPEVLMARRLGMEVMMFSVLTDDCHPLKSGVTALQDILDAAESMAEKLTWIVQMLVATYNMKALHPKLPLL